MAITLNDLTISPAGIDRESLLLDWSWALPEPALPVLISALGDVMAQGQSGAVYFIDTVEGSVARVAEDGQSFQDLLKDPQFVTNHFFPSRIVQMRDAGVLLKAGQVYSHKVPLVLGGEDEPNNIEPTDVQVHVGIQGQIHRQVNELPEGTPISEIKIE